MTNGEWNALLDEREQLLQKKREVGRWSFGELARLARVCQLLGLWVDGGAENCILHCTERICDMVMDTICPDLDEITDEEFDKWLNRMQAGILRDLGEDDLADEVENRTRVSQ